MPKKRNSGIQTYQMFTNDDEVCIPSLSSIFLAVICVAIKNSKRKYITSATNSQMFSIAIYSRVEKPELIRRHPQTVLDFNKSR